jgi:signal transduction histidine kinase
LTTVFILRRGNRIKQHLNGELQQKNIDLEKTLDRLKSTQAQLIQSEKMASLGELTAGIAHEIQNPLNFVNNFSDVNTELVSELLSNLQNGNIKEAEGLATELGENEKKINHHGKRADTIVKSMLQHSRASNGQKELTDINAFCNEYARLAYHGMRSRDSSFSITLNTDLNPAIGKVNINAQDLGRVVVNLINNAFYAVQEKAKTAGEDYIPEVLLKTGIDRQSNREYFFIRIKDNGIGIPEKIKQKIFQPFFTTKPTGEGTGLGLSLSFDIIRAHGGQLHVISQEGLGSEFEIQLPV